MVLVGADCTGHGVPGAIMSMLGVTLLNAELKENHIPRPSNILENLRVNVKETLAHKGKVNDQKDGMEMAFLVVDKENMQLQYAGANYPLYLIRKKELISGTDLEPHASVENSDYQLYVIRGDKMPIGNHWEEKAFSNHVFRLQEQDSLYISSDGFVDQFGGESRKKFKSVNFKKLLLSIQEEPMAAQVCSIQNAFDTWRGNHEQIDDVSVIGIKI
jgi:serine phosphatase RsbU (regulator of sigma subunit)